MPDYFFEVSRSLGPALVELTGAQLDELGLRVTAAQVVLELLHVMR